jgi:hypothetical protein
MISILKRTYNALDQFSGDNVHSILPYKWVLHAVSVCVQLYCVGFHCFTTCFGLHGHLQVCTIFYFHMLEGFCFAAFFFCLFFTWSHSACFHLCFFLCFPSFFLFPCVCVCVCVCVCLLYPCISISITVHSRVTELITSSTPKCFKILFPLAEVRAAYNQATEELRAYSDQSISIFRYKHWMSIRL